MPRTGRPPLSVEEKRRRGTLRPGRTPGVHQHERPVSPIVAADATLSPADALDRVLDDGVHWIGATDLVAVVMLRLQLERHAEITDAVGAGGAKWSDLLALEREIAKALGALGFTPTERGRLGVGEVRER